MDGDIIATCMLLSYIYPVVISSGLPLRTVLGVSHTYKPGSDVAELSWQLHPPNAEIFYVKCNHSNSGTSTQEVLSYEWNKSDPTFQHNLNKRATIYRNDTTFSIIINNPTKQDTGWYICVFNTQQSVDIQGALKLDKLSDSVQFVQGILRNFTLYDPAASLVWTIHPPFANVSGIHCFAQNRGTQVDILHSNWKSSDSTRFAGILHESYFELLVTQPTDADKGDYNCSFVSKNSVKSSVAKLSLVSAPDRSLSFALVPWTILIGVVSIALLIIPIVILVFYLKRRRKTSVTKAESSETSVRMSPLTSSSQQTADSEIQPLTTEAPTVQQHDAKETFDEQVRATKERYEEQLRAAKDEFNQDKMKFEEDLKKKQEEVTALTNKIEELEKTQKHFEGEDQVDHGMLLQKQVEEKDAKLKKLILDYEKKVKDYEQTLKTQIMTGQQLQAQLLEQQHLVTMVDEKLLKSKQKLKEKKMEVQDLKTELQDLPDNLTWEVWQKAQKRFSDMHEDQREALLGKISDLLLESLHDIKIYAKKEKQDEKCHMIEPKSYPVSSTADVGVRMHETAFLHSQGSNIQGMADYVGGAAATNVSQSSTALHTDAAISDGTGLPSSGRTQGRLSDQRSQGRSDTGRGPTLIVDEPEVLTVDVGQHKTASEPQTPTETPPTPPTPPGSQPQNQDE